MAEKRYLNSFTMITEWRPLMAQLTAVSKGFLLDGLYEFAETGACSESTLEMMGEAAKMVYIMVTEKLKKDKSARAGWTPEGREKSLQTRRAKKAKRESKIAKNLYGTKNAQNADNVNADNVQNLYDTNQDANACKIGGCEEQEGENFVYSNSNSNIIKRNIYKENDGKLDDFVGQYDHQQLMSLRGLLKGKTLRAKQRIVELMGTELLADYPDNRDDIVAFMRWWAQTGDDSATMMLEEQSYWDSKTRFESWLKRDRS